MKSRNLKSIFFMSLPIVFAFSAVSCGNDYNKLHDNYVMHKNSPNKANNFSYAYANSYDDILKEINLATGSKLLRIASQNQPQIDFRDNISNKPTELWYQFEYLYSLSVSYKFQTSSSSITYRNNKIKQVIYEDVSESAQDPKYYYPKKDKGNGFYNPYLFVPSGDSESINYADKSNQYAGLFNQLKAAYTLSLKVKNNENPWINFKGEIAKSDGYPLNVKAIDFKLGLLRTLLQNKSFRDKFIEQNNLTEIKKLEEKFYTKDNPYFNGPDLEEFFKTHNVKLEKLLKLLSFNKAELNKQMHSDVIDFETEDDKEHNWIDFFKHLFLYSNYMDAMPFEYLTNKYGEDLFNDKGFRWFYEYGKDYKQMLYSSYYYVNHNSQNQTTLYRNENYHKDDSISWQKQKHLNEIIYKYNTIPLPQETFNVQMFNAFKQNIISKLDVSNLNNDQKEYIFSNYKDFNLNFERQFEKYNLHNKIALNNLPYGNQFYFNNEFSKLYYGKKIGELTNQNAKISTYTNNLNSLQFRNLINHVINVYGLINMQNLNNDAWFSQAPSDINISSKNSNETNYNVLKDAQENINKQILLKKNINNKLEKSNNTTQYDNKQLANKLSNGSSLESKLKTIDFEFIKTEINKLLENTKESVEWTIPILGFNLKENQVADLKTIEHIFKSINPLLKPKIKIISNYDEYKEYFQSNKSIYKESTFNLSESSTTAFIKEILRKDNFELLTYIINFLNQIDDNSYLELKSLIVNLRSKLDANVNKTLEEKTLNTKLDNDTINKILSILTSYLNNLNTNNVVNLINEINNLVSYTISYENTISLSNFTKSVYQKFIVKPFTYDGLSYLQDIYLK